MNTHVVFGELLMEILEFVESGDLFHSARLVSRSWRDGATKILLQRQDLKTTLKFCEEKHQFHRCKVKKNKETSIEVTEKHPSLSDLCDLLDSPNYFPSRDFRLNDGRLDLPDALHFFTRHGDKVRSLTCDINDNEPRLRDGVLYRKIYKLTPNLENLEFSASSRLEYGCKSNKIFSRNLDVYIYDIPSQDQNKVLLERLPLLKSIKFKSHSRIASGIIPYRTFLSIRPLAPQISTVFISQIEKTFGSREDRMYLKLLAQQTQIMTETLNCPSFDENPSYFNEISQLNLKVSKLCIPAISNPNEEKLQTPAPQTFSFKEIPQGFSRVLRIMENTKSSLECLNCRITFFLLFKKMEHSHFHLKYKSGVDSAFTNFPKLKSLELDFQDFTTFPKFTDFPDIQDSQNFDKFNPEACEELELESENYAELPSCFKEVRNVVLKLPEDGADACEEFFNLPNYKPNLNWNLRRNSNVTSLSIHKKTGMTSGILGKIVKCFPSLKKLVLTFDGDAKKIQSKIQTQCLCNHDDDDQNVSLVTLLSFFVTDLKERSKVTELHLFNNLNLHGLTELHLNVQSDCGSKTVKCGAGGSKKFPVFVNASTMENTSASNSSSACCSFFFLVVVNDVCSRRSK